VPPVKKIQKKNLINYLKIGYQLKAFNVNKPKIKFALQKYEEKKFFFTQANSSQKAI
jgi:hypothetical protein